MINALYGMLGAFLTLLLFAAGVYVGYRLHAKIAEHEAAQRPKLETPEEAERRRLIADNNAFRTLANYNADMAYGTTVVDQFTLEDGDI